MKIQRFLIAACCTLAASQPVAFFSGTAWAGDAAPAEEAQAPELLAKIQALIADLGHENQGKRDEAQKALQEIGKPAIPLLRKSAEESEDAEVRERCRLLVEDYEGARFDRLLVKGFREDGEFLKVLKGLWEHDEPALDEKGWAETLNKGKGRIAVAGQDKLLVEPCRFYMVPGHNCGLLCRPPIYMTVGVTEKGRLFLLEFNLRFYDGLPELARRLKPVKDEKNAVKAALLAARLTALCLNCFYWPGYPPPAEKDASVKRAADGGFEVDIKDTGGGGATVIFSKEGRLLSASRVGHPCRRK